MADARIGVTGAGELAMLRSSADGSVADAHLGAAALAVPDAEVTIVTSDPLDMKRVAEGRDVTIVTI
jgi:hypothetical protein